MSFSKDKDWISLSTILFIIVCLLLTNQGTCLALNQTLNYTDCTPERNCLSCLNQYICKQCAPLQQCCPKRCISCTNDTTCTECDPGFQITQIAQKGWKICANKDSYTNMDYHRIKIPNKISNTISDQQYHYQSSNVSTKCQKGYYYETNIKFCQKCRVKNCQSCRDSIHCFICENNFFLFNGLCLTWDDVKQTFEATPSNKTGNSTVEQLTVDTQKMKKDEGQAYLFFMILGILVGTCCTCILVQLCSCVTGCIKKCFRKLFKSDDEIIFIEDQMSKYSQTEIQGNNDKRSKNTQSSQMNENNNFQRINE